MGRIPASWNLGQGRGVRAEMGAGDRESPMGAEGTRVSGGMLCGCVRPVTYGTLRAAPGVGAVTAPAIARTELRADGNEEKWPFRYLQTDVHYARGCLGSHPAKQAEPT